ncbi:hypothetical protein ETW23_13180 [Leisingera sp. NJS201]|nr:hypothetical protein ETW23_13180 [Leisingera sp. NJS201]
MSDPVTHAEIEDVLSSIRRLVSDDSRSGPAAPEPAARLVLTPALRVQEDGPDSPRQLMILQRTTLQRRHPGLRPAAWLRAQPALQRWRGPGRARPFWKRKPR